MTAQDSEAECLRRAATLVRDRAAAATPGPLRLARYDNRERGGRLAVVEPDGPGLHDHGRRRLVADLFHEGDREWYAATVTPGIGAPLAAWLDTAALFVEQAAEARQPIPTLTLDALEVARAVLVADGIEDFP